MAKIQPFRDGTLQDRTQLRVRLNELVQAVNQTALRFSTRRIANVQVGMQIVTASPGFTVGAIAMGGVNSTTGGSNPGQAPWISNWVQQPDGRITFYVNALAAAPALYSVNVIFFEQETS